MNRKGVIVLALGVVVAAVVLGLPGLLRRGDRPALERVAARVDSHYGLNMQLVPFHQGWFSSSAVVKFAIPAHYHHRRADTNVRHSATVGVKIDHGPYPFVGWGHGDFSLEPVMAVVHVRVASDHDAKRPVPFAGLHATTTIGLLGHSVTHVRWKAGKFSTETPKHRSVRMHWGDLTGTIWAAKDFSRSHSRISIPRFEIDGPKGAVVTIKGVKVDSREHRASYGLRLGSAEVTNKEVAVRLAGARSAAPASAAVDIKGIRLTDRISGDNGPLGFKMAFTVNRLDVGHEHFGPLVWKMSMSGLNGRVIAHAQKQIQAIQRRHDMPPAVLANAMLSVLAQTGLQVLGDNPELNLSEVSVTTPEGKGVIRADLKLIGYGAPLTASEWQHRLRGHASISIPQAWLRTVSRSRAAMRDKSARAWAHNLRIFQQRGIVACHQGQCRAALHYDRAGLSVNGHLLFRN